MILSWLTGLFTTLIYQPFFNLLVSVYYLLGLAPQLPKDMGWAVIIFTFIFRILWLPISLSSDRKEKDKRTISARYKALQEEYAKDPIKRKAEEKQLMKENRGLLIATFVDIGFQVLIALMLYRIFTKGLEGADFHLLYRFVPQPKEPFNLTFMGKYDLSHPNVTLNLIQSACILVVELLSAMFSPIPARRSDMTTVFVLPVISYLFFSMMPAGKKLFIIVTLLFSIGLMLVKRCLYWYHSLNHQLENWVTRQAEVRQQTQAKSSGI